MSEFILPDIGEGIVECELLEWLVKEGDIIVEDQAVAEVMTDKATVQIPAMHNGRVTKLYYKEGDIAKVHQPLFAMDIEGDVENSLKATNEEASIEPLGSNSDGKSMKQVSENENVLEAFILPDIGEGIVECEIVKWCIQEGDIVEEDQVVVEVMTDKAVVEIPAKYRGKVSKLHYQQGDIAKVHTPLFDQLITSTMIHHTSLDSRDDLESNNTTINNSSAELAQDDSPFNNPAKALASPAVRRIAREHKINLAKVPGTGKKGRVLKHDIDTYLRSGSVDESFSATSPSPSSAVSSSAVSSSAVSSSAVSPSSATSLQQGVSKEVPIRGIRAAMAKQMQASVSTIPHFTVSDELIMDKLISLRATLKPEFEQQGVKLSFMPFFIKSLSLALKSFPEINSRLTDDGSTLHYLSSHNIGMAVDSKIGLLVPNIKNVQDLSLHEVALECDRIINAAREGKLSNADLSNGSISISNIGALGGISATPVINKPEVAIVALGKTQKLPRFDEAGNVFAQSIMMVNWSGDHRVIDGATMVRFNNLWMSYLQSPEKMLAHLK